MNEDEQFRELRDEMRRNNAALHRELAKKVRSELTPDQLQRDWDEISGATTDQRRAKASADEQESFSIVELIARVLRGRRAYAAGLGMVLAVTCVLVFRSESLDMRKLPNPDLSPEISLPRNLRLDLKNNRMELFEANDRLSGTMTPTNSPVGTIGFNVLLRGKDGNGIEAVLHGTFWMTNAPGRTTIKKSSDTTGALLRGFFEVPGKLTNEVEQPFGP